MYESFAKVLSSVILAGVFCEIVKCKVRDNTVNDGRKTSKPIVHPIVENINGDTLATVYGINKGLGYLSADEIVFAVGVVKARHSSRDLQFIEINYNEPTKVDLVNYYNLYKCAIPRRIEVISMDIKLNQTLLDYIIVRGENTKAATSTNDYFNEKTVVLQDVQAGISPNEYTFVEKLCKAYGPLRDSMVARGLDPEGIAVDSWCCGHTGPDCDPSERICWPSLHYCDPNGKDEIIYARPIEGIDVRISLTHKKVISYRDTGLGSLPIPGSDDSFLPRYVPIEECRKDLKPIVITQPDGPAWTVSDRNTVNWQKWTMQVGFNSREGLTLHGIMYENRPILHKFSMCEMVVPYGDPRPPHCLKNAFDAGEDGLGRNANSLVLGCDCLGVIHYFDGNLVHDNGDLFVVKNAVCMHEEDMGLLWKHTDWRTGIPFTRRARRLGFSFTCTIANYEYGFFFYFYLDGSIESEVKLTGVLSTGALSVDELKAGGRKYGIKLGGSLYAPVHQHLFVARMDFVVDGTNNRVIELNAERETEGSHNPTLNAFFFTEKLLETELGTDCNPASARFWKVQSSNRRNKIGGLTGYKMMPGNKIGCFAPLDRASHLKRAQFLEHQVWVTPFTHDQKFPAGTFVNQNPKLDGLPVWVKERRSIVDTDIVVWHMFGVTHLPRPEDWPIMPVEHCSFHLKPSGFFEHSPCMDVPPLSKATKACCVQSQTSECIPAAGTVHTYH